jgi:uncharacterized protein (TIGR03579 family)
MKKFNDFLMKDETFVLLIAGAAAAIFAGTYMFINFNVGAFNEVSVTAMLSDGLNGGDYSAAAGFAAGFLIARILEGPLVGLLDIGGALQTGVGIGIPALLLSAGITFPLSNFFVSLLCGALIGLVLGIVIILIRKFVPEGVSVGGTDVMMGAGNRTGRFLGPLIIVAACSYNPWVGIGSIIGAAIFYKWGKDITGGAIIGAMILGAIFL